LAHLSEAWGKRGKSGRGFCGLLRRGFPDNLDMRHCPFAAKWEGDVAGIRPVAAGACLFNYVQVYPVS
jgi:hypothetical protein